MLMTERVIIAWILAILLMPAPAWSQITQIVEISSSPNPVGSGARALGMGGAFIGVADDATAASWNPAGLIQLETPEVSIVGGYNHRTEDARYAAFPEASGPQEAAAYELNYLSLAFPFTFFSRNMIVSLNYQHLYDFNKEADFSYSLADHTPPPLFLRNNIHYDQEGAFRALSPAFAAQITPDLSLGFTVNLWGHGIYDNCWESTYRSWGGGTFGGDPFNVNTLIRERYDMKGLRIDPGNPAHWYNANFNIGLMWNMAPKLTLGAVFKSPFEAIMEHSFEFDSAITFPASPASDSHNVFRYEETVKLDMPMSFGMGLAARLSDVLTLGLDVYWTDWSKYALRDGEGNLMNPITGRLQSHSDIADTIQVRLGGEQLFIKERVVIPVRAGLFYDPEPAEKDPDGFWGISIGSGVAYKAFVYDIAYQYRFGRNVRSTTVAGREASQDVDQHTVYMSVIYHF